MDCELPISGMSLRSQAAASIISANESRSDDYSVKKSLHSLSRRSSSLASTTAMLCWQGCYALLYTVFPKKLDHQTHGGNFVKS